MKYQPPQTQHEESLRQEVIDKLKAKVVIQKKEIEKLQSEKKQLKQELSEVKYNLNTISNATISLKKDNVRKKNEAKAWEDRYLQSLGGNNNATVYFIIAMIAIIYGIIVTVHCL